ncbi:MAG: RNA polymerase factor sigma-54 [Legionella sp. 40-6]|nr:RNA polymerase factor sigma-54 [Legionella sp.]OJY35268.1 MAG: RNA polymerase factor sigma-54 [Legionella sp. 40-6]
MKTSLQLGLGQHLTITPQLQQAIRLLQLSTADLQQEIQQLVESNPMLEATPHEENDELRVNLGSEPPDEIDDFRWSEIYQLSTRSNYNEPPDNNFDNFSISNSGLRNYLQKQLEVSSISDIQWVIATALIDATNEDGFLTLPLHELHASLNSKEYPLTLTDIESVRERLNSFDPVGCVTLNLTETLLVQLKNKPETLPGLTIAKQIIGQNIELLAQHNYKQLMKIHRINDEELKEVLCLIHSLNPKPGNLIQTADTQYLIPDLTVKKVHHGWKVILNNAVLPNLSINHHYASLIQRADNSADNQFLKNNLQEARWFLKSLQSRQETLLKVASYIIDYQKDFLDSGEEAMRPLVLNHVAAALNMHESTISRVTTQKFIHTPRGLFELKYFFSSHLNTSTGDCSSTAIRALIKKLIGAEDRNKPLSDSRISIMLQEKGIEVARRTVAKYREGMGIAPSNERKNIGN